MVNVTKADGTRQPFEKNKIIKTCLRMKVNKYVAEQIADKIEKRIYEGISTKQILKMIFNFIAEYRPETKHQIDLREAVCMIRPKPDFEQFVALLLKANGYDVKTNKIIQGKCVEHEIDAIASKSKETLYVEVKHHYQPHSYTGVGVFLEAQATFEDIVDGYKLGKNKVNFSTALVVCNTKISNHARRYATCRNIQHLGWKSPHDRGLEFLIEENKLYPTTLIKGIDASMQAKLGDNGIVLIEQLVNYDVKELSKLTKTNKSRIEELLRKANEILA